MTLSRLHLQRACLRISALGLLISACTPGARAPHSTGETTSRVLASRVEVIRTEYGVPHVYAEDFLSLGYALGYLQVEDYGVQVPLGLLRARGELARYQGRRTLDSDFENRQSYLRAVEVYESLERDTRDVYEGFALGVGRYVALHPEEFPDWMPSGFTGYDVAALYVYRPSAGEVRRWTNRLRNPGSPTPETPETSDTSETEGSSAWALAPSRTASGAAILLRNPHLSWNAGYWEVHVVVPGRLDFYGDFRIGGPLGIIGGFNRQLGFATTNNEVDSSEVYALARDPDRTDHYLLDGQSLPVQRQEMTLAWVEGDEEMSDTRVRLSTELGPVVYQNEDNVYVLRAAEDGLFRGGEQFLRLMQARSLEEWKEAMRLGAHPVSNFVYADAEGNIFYIWNAAIPLRPHPAGGDRAVPVTRSEQAWTRLHDLESLPQLLNPPGGYVRNENDGPWLTNLRRPLDPIEYPPYFEENTLRLRSQHALLLIDNEERFSLEDVVRLKHSYRMLLATRVKDDLLEAVRDGLSGDTAPPDAERQDLVAALRLLEQWDDSVAPESRGSVLFDAWWNLYTQALGEREPFAEPWSESTPLETPRGLAEPGLAAEVFPRALRRTTERFGSWSVAWGEVHRVRRGGLDLPVGGCSGAMGCFRVLDFRTDPDGRRSVSGGDGWVIAVEFTDPPRAYSILGYGESSREGSPHHADQAGLFARGEMKVVAYTRAAVERSAIRRYHPGLD